jgi:hypothetical protein
MTRTPGAIRTAASVFTLLLVAAPAVVAEPARAADGWTWPVDGEVVTPYRNGDDPYAGGQHRGIDIAAPAGAPVAAAAEGTVTFAGVAGASGLTVGIRSADGRFDTSYLHLASAAVRAGERVRASARIGTVGTTGRRSVEAPHLHFGVRDAGTRHAYRDPLDLLPPRGSRPAPDPRTPVPVPVPSPLVPRAAALPAPVAPEHVPASPFVPRAAPGATRVLRPIPGLTPAPRVATASAPHDPTTSAPHVARAWAPAGASAPAREGSRARTAASPAPRGHAAPGAEQPQRETRPSDRLSRATAAAPTSGPAPAAAEPPRGSGPPPRTRPAPGPGGDGGLDLGWLAACLGLVVAATALGRPDAARAAAGRGRAVAGALLRPIRDRA